MGQSSDDDDASTTQNIGIDDVRAGDTLAPPIAAPSARLVCLVGHVVGEVFALGPRGALIGRASEADISLDGFDVSRAHARIEWQGGRFVLEDLGSRNGTQVNGVPLRAPHPLAIGDRIQVGASAVLVFARPDDLERRAQRLQKLDGLAQLAGGVVHDFKNSLHVILGNLDVLDELAAADPRLSEPLAAIRTASTAASALTQRLLYFAGKGGGAQVRVAMAALVGEVVAMTRRAIGERTIEVAVSVAPDLAVRGDPAELHHALVNLVLNARDAMPKGGRLAIEARTLVLAHPEALALHLPTAGAFVELSVSDTGVGMDEATIGHVFEPFFTTKGEGGTGLGLSTVYGVIRRHGGNVLVDSTPGAGSVFRILLPQAASGT